MEIEIALELNLRYSCKMFNPGSRQVETYQLRFCLKKMSIYVMKNGHIWMKNFTNGTNTSFCMTHLLWDPMVKKKKLEHSGL